MNTASPRWAPAIHAPVMSERQTPAAHKCFKARQLIMAVGLGFLLGPWARSAKPLPQTEVNSTRSAVPSDDRGTSAGAVSEHQAVARPDLLIVESPQTLSDPTPERSPRGSRLARLSPSDRTPHPLTSDFFAAADPQISFDGTHLLFAGRKTSDSRWQIWEIGVDGSDARQVSHCSGDCFGPSYLPRGQIVYTATRSGPTGGGWSAAPDHSASARSTTARLNVRSELWISKLDGSDALPITFGPGDFQVETVLQNGMILATARSPLLPSNGAPADRELYTLRPDGTGLSTLRCDHEHPAIRSQARELEDGAVVFVKTPLTRSGQNGQLTWIHRGALRDEPVTAVPLLASHPQSLGAGRMLVALGNPDGAVTRKRTSLAIFDPELGRLGAPIYEDSELLSIEAVLVASHTPPRWYWSTLNPELKRGYFVCVNSYLAQGVPSGQIKAKLARVRILTLDQASEKESLLGEAPIEEDGSFYIAVPADTPVRFAVINSAGRVVREQRSWIWSRSGEEHGCVGCHEDRALAPENRWPLALRHLDGPIRLDLKAAQTISASSRQ